MRGRRHCAYTEEKKKDNHRFKIETVGTRREETPKAFTKIHCHISITSPDITPEEPHKVAQLSIEKYCSVAASLKAEITFSVEVK